MTRLKDLNPVRKVRGIRRRLVCCVRCHGCGTLPDFWYFEERICPVYDGAGELVVTR